MTDDVDRYLESALDEALEAVGITWEDYTCDYDDGSIVLYGCGGWAPTEEQKLAIWEMGFDRFWTHPGPEKTKADEKYYWKPRP